jgi:hypothetical protein
MRHARADYDRIQDPAELIPADEPVFLLRGQDRFAPAIVRAYATALKEYSPALAERARRWAQEMEAWQSKNGSKIPDMPEVKP